MTEDISWYTKYLGDVGDSDVDLDELVRENERIKERLSLLSGVQVRKIRWKKRKRNQSRDSSSTKKRRPVVRSFGTNNLNQFLRVPLKPIIERAPQPSSETLSGFEARFSGEHCETQPPPFVKHVLRPISQRHVKLDEVGSRSTGTEPLKFNFGEKLVHVVRNSRDDSNHDWRRQHSTETDEEEEDGLKSPVVSDLVSKFESVRQSSTFSHGKTKAYDPYSSLERKTSRSKEEENQRRSIRVIRHNNPPLDEIDSYENHATPHEGHKFIRLTPQRHSDASTYAPLLRMKSEGHSRVYPANLSGLTRPATDQFSRSPSMPKSLKKGYSFDSGFSTQKLVHHPVTFTTDHMTPSNATSHNHAPVVSTLPLIPLEAAASIHRAHVASNDRASFRRSSTKSSFEKNPGNYDAARQLDRSFDKEMDPVPSWKSEVEMRKKTKSYLSAHKPEQPLQLGSIPEWKRLLLEKNKQKRNSTENRHVPINTQITKPDAGINFTEPAWRLEFDKIKRHVTLQTNNHDAPHVFERKVPEWVKLAEQRRKSKILNDNEDV